MSAKLTDRLLTFLDEYQPWTNVYGLARSVMALATAGTLAANAPETLFRPGSGTSLPPFCDGIRHASVFCVAPRSDLNLIRWLCVAALLVVASGWRPRVTGLLHWWISFSLQASALMIEGGDQVAAVLTLLLLPVTLTDPRRWHWAAAPSPSESRGEAHRRLAAAFGHGLVRLQIAGIYFHAATGKLGVPEWKDGTALFYWGTHESFGAPPWLPLFHALVVYGPTVALLTWSVILLELSLSVALWMEKTYRRALMVAGMTMHFGIIFVHGLPAFSLTMLAALLLYLHPWRDALSWPNKLAARISGAVQSRLRGARVVPLGPAQPAGDGATR